MKVAIPKERRTDERRVAATPDTVKKLIQLGCTVAVEAGAGVGANLSDEAFQAAGATIAKDAKGAVGDAEVVLRVQRPLEAADGNDEIAMMKQGAVLVGLLDPLVHKAQVDAYAARGIVSFAMELVPRISRAQTMDALSSQSNLAGYRAVIEAAEAFGKALPLMMTAAGTIAPARVFVMGAGVAGLQAIATAKRLGAVVSGTDVRKAAAEQVESLGATFLAPPDVGDAETKGGYAKELDAEKQRQQALITAEHLKKQDIVICTALIPGRPAPVLITEDMVRGMKAGSVIVDLAVESGGNCTLSKPGEKIVAHGVSILGYRNITSRVAVDASSLYARNLLNFLTPLVKAGALAIDWNDEIVTGTLLTRDGKVVHPRLSGA